MMVKTHWSNICHLLDVLKALNLDNPEARHMQLSCPVWVDFNVQFLTVLTQEVSEIQKRKHCLVTLTWDKQG